MQIIREWYKIKKLPIPTIQDVIRFLMTRYAKDLEEQIFVITKQKEAAKLKLKEYQFKIKNASSKLAKARKVQHTLIAENKRLKVKNAQDQLVGTPISPSPEQNSEIDPQVVPRKYIIKIDTCDSHEN